MRRRQGNPKLTLVNAREPGEGARQSGGRRGGSVGALRGRHEGAPAGGGGCAKQPSQLDTIVGRGHTVLRQMGADGMEQVSAGDALDAKFRPNVEDWRGRGRDIAPQRLVVAGVLAANSQAGRGSLADSLSQARCSRSMSR